MGTIMSFMGEPKISISIPTIKRECKLNQLVNDSEFGVMASALLNEFDDITVRVTSDENYRYIIIPELKFNREHSQTNEIMTCIRKDGHGLRFNNSTNEYNVIYEEDGKYWIHEACEYCEELRTYYAESEIWSTQDSVEAAKQIMKVYQAQLTENTFVHDPRSMIKEYD